MKKIIALLLLANCFLISTHAQSGDPKVDELIKQMQKKPGSYEAVINGKTIKGNVIIVKLADNKGYAIMSPPTENRTIALKIPKAAAGTYTTVKDENLIIGTTTYAINEGSIVLKETNGKFSGSFTGNLYTVGKKKSKFDVPAGKVTGTFTNLLKP
jgi:hypothetical protein